MSDNDETSPINETSGNDESSQTDESSQHDETSQTDETTGLFTGSNRGALAEDAAHPFDQTNGIVDGLEGNADDPDQVNERISTDPDATDGDTDDPQTP